MQVKAYSEHYAEDNSPYFYDGSLTVENIELSDPVLLTKFEEWADALDCCAKVIFVVNDVAVYTYTRIY